ncbi:GNAT family protein [Dehalogenimonas sp. THU2]|uniref:GNAT family N-acetyltransferase n=1 Tax=Dehalogenimonas sp. THU2 TaxID=3151121 RepID=UPI0032183224
MRVEKKLPKIALRAKRLDDAALDYQWQTDLEFSRLHVQPPLTLSFTEFAAEYAIILKNQWPGRIQFAIETGEGLHIGDCACHNINRATKEAEIGINIGRREYWGQGYGVAALRGLVDYTFRQTDLQKLRLRTLPDNLRAQRCFAKAGFTVAGSVREGEVSFVQMELTRRDWEKQAEKQ